MNAKKLNEITSWLQDRMEAGRNEENGSMDWANFGRLHVTIMKDEEGYLVYLGENFTPDYTLTDSMTFDEIMSEIAAA